MKVAQRRLTQCTLMAKTVTLRLQDVFFRFRHASTQCIEGQDMQFAYWPKAKGTPMQVRELHGTRKRGKATGVPKLEHQGLGRLKKRRQPQKHALHT